MNHISVNQFRSHLKHFVETAIDNHEPLKITRRKGKDFIVLSADDWEREQTTLAILQNTDLMKQIALSSASHLKNQGYQPNSKKLDEIINL